MQNGGLEERGRKPSDRPLLALMNRVVSTTSQSLIAAKPLNARRSRPIPTHMCYRKTAEARLSVTSQQSSLSIQLALPIFDCRLPAWSFTFIFPRSSSISSPLVRFHQSAHVESRKHQTGTVPCTVYNKSHSRLHVVAVGTNIHLVKQTNLNIRDTKRCVNSWGRSLMDIAQ